jgi:signal transduction histidine kinase
VAEWVRHGRGRIAPTRAMGSWLEGEKLALLEHEIRTPLAAIRAIAEILREEDELEPAERAAMLEALLLEQARLARTLEALLDELAGS